MIIRKITLLCLFISYSLVLGHSIFAHDHHDGEFETVVLQFHSTDDHGHSHDFNFSDAFIKYFHAGDEEVFIKNYSSKKLTFKPGHILFNGLITISDKSPPLVNQYERPFIALTKIQLSYTGLRAPPLS